MEQRGINVLALFDGISCGQAALNRLKILIGKYFASEIDKTAIKITQARFPKTIQLGDVRNIKGEDFKYTTIDLITAGSPCQDVSLAHTGRVGLEAESLEEYLKLKSEGYQFKGHSHLFWEFVRIKTELHVPYFFLENVKMGKKMMGIITKALGVEPIKINSSLVSAQNRERYYWTNIPNVSIPEDRGIMFYDIIPGAVATGKRGRPASSELKKLIPTSKKGYHYPEVQRTDGKSNCITTSRGNTACYIDKYGDKQTLTVAEAEILQTLDKGYTDIPGLSKSARYKSIGNSWTVEVIMEIFKNLKSYVKNL